MRPPSRLCPSVGWSVYPCITITAEKEQFSLQLDSPNLVGIFGECVHVALGGQIPDFDVQYEDENVK